MYPSTPLSRQSAWVFPCTRKYTFSTSRSSLRENANIFIEFGARRSLTYFSILCCIFYLYFSALKSRFLYRVIWHVCLCLKFRSKASTLPQYRIRKTRPEISPRLIRRLLPVAAFCGLLRPLFVRHDGITARWFVLERKVESIRYFNESVHCRSIPIVLARV